MSPGCAGGAIFNSRAIRAVSAGMTANSGQSHAVVRTDSKLQPFCVLPAEEGLAGAIELQVVVL